MKEDNTPIIFAAVVPTTGTGARRGGNGTVWVSYVAGIILCGVLFSTFQVEPVPMKLTMTAIALIAVCLFPLALWMAGSRSSLPMFELICIAYAGAYSLPLVTLENTIAIKAQLIWMTWSATGQALEYSLVGSLVMIVGYYAARRTGFGARWRIDLPMTEQKTRLLAMVALPVATALAMPNALGVLASYGSFWATLSNSMYIFVLVAIAKLAATVFGAGLKSSSFLSVMLLALISVMAVLGLSIGMLEAALTPIIATVLVYWVYRRKFPWIAVALLIFALAVLNEAKHQYRRDTWFTDRSFSIAEKVHIWIMATEEVIQRKVVGATYNYEPNAETGVIRRVDLLHIFAYITEVTPGIIPYYRGQTYSYLLIGWIPRILWPDKPIAAASNNLLAIDYELLSLDQLNSTMTGIGIVAEAYANSGLVGIIIVMTLFGVILAVANNVLNGSNSDCGSAIYLTLMFSFLNGIGSSTTQLFYFVILNTLVLTLLLRLFATSFRARARFGALIHRGNAGLGVIR